MDIADLEPGDDTESLSLDTLLTSLEITMNLDDYYTKQQQDHLEARRQAITPERMRDVEQEWRALIAAVRTEMERDTDPTTDPVLGHARQWRGLIDEFTGTDPGIEASLQKLNSEQPQVMQSQGFQLDAEAMA